MGEKLHIYIAYRNHSGFVSCFALRFIRLDNPTFRLKDFDLAIKCQTAYIEPRFDRLISEKAIILKCCLNDVTFAGIEEKVGNRSGLPIFFPESTGALLDKLTKIRYEVINTTLAVYGDRVRFLSYQAISKEVKLDASGTILEAGDFDISIDVFFSPEIVGQAPDALKALLTERHDGWFSYHIDGESKHDTPSLEINSDKFNLSIKRIKVNK
ncbi:MAG: hypothetical protein A2Z72_03980 [Omnitrophica bacterium RBG_13_46_9]|nr:MAG: hypothetical protein A2Z72_03980 [Omnitrophica bacterium RBG_13_46_9]